MEGRRTADVACSLAARRRPPQRRSAATAMSRRFGTISSSTRAKRLFQTDGFRNKVLVYLLFCIPRYLSSILRIELLQPFSCGLMNAKLSLMHWSFYLLRFQCTSKCDPQNHLGNGQVLVGQQLATRIGKRLFFLIFGLFETFWSLIRILFFHSTKIINRKLPFIPTTSIKYTAEK